MPGVHLLWAEAEFAGAQPGQFVMVRCREGYDPLLRRPLSLFSSSSRPPTARIGLLFAVVGRGTAWLARRRPGETMDLLGPLGRGFSIHPASRALLLVAGGLGVAPLMALAEAALSSGRSVTLLLGAPSATQVLPHHLLPSGIKLIVTTEDGSLGNRGLATDLLPQLAPQSDQVFACGPISMYRAMLEPWEGGRGGELTKGGEFEKGGGLGKRRELEIQVSLEARMGCGHGACLGCAIETRQGMKLVCGDGPIFPLQDVLWEKLTL